MTENRDSPQAPPSPVDNQALKSALDFIAYRDRSEREVRDRLESRFPEAIAEQVVNWLRARGYVDDARFALAWREQRERKRPKGERLIRRELLELGVAAPDVDQALDGFDSDACARRATREWWARQPVKNAPDYVKARRRLWGYLERRGFESELISRTVRAFWEELSNPEDGQIDSEAHEQQTPYTEDLW